MTTVRDLSLLGVPEDVAVPLLQYVAALNELDATRRAELKADGQHEYLPDRYAYYGVDLQATGGGKYLRVIMTHSSDLREQRSVHSFVVKADGRVVKSAGWAGPAKSLAKGRKGELMSKYTLTDPESLAKLLADLDPFGGYLYS